MKQHVLASLCRDEETFGPIEFSMFLLMTMDTDHEIRNPSSIFTSCLSVILIDDDIHAPLFRRLHMSLALS